ncbi:MAG: SWIM zinc finger family protein, partial [Myxococcales bacterium]|nr:SWIM zinc finger family protein [Myxococcales bacterium]
MRALLDAVRESCVERAWSQGVELVRAGGVVAEPGDGDDELLFRIRDRGLAVSPTVTLWIDDREWDCDCPIRQDPCRHVAAAVIALARAREEGEALPRG